MAECRMPRSLRCTHTAHHTAEPRRQCGTAPIDQSLMCPCNSAQCLAISAINAASCQATWDGTACLRTAMASARCTHGGSMAAERGGGHRLPTAALLPVLQSTRSVGSCGSDHRMALLEAVAAASRPFPLPAGFRPSYGTAGFRAMADLLHSTMFRCGCAPVPSQRPAPALPERPPRRPPAGAAS